MREMSLLKRRARVSEGSQRALQTRLEIRRVRGSRLDTHRFDLPKRQRLNESISWVMLVRVGLAALSGGAIEAPLLEGS